MLIGPGKRIRSTSRRTDPPKGYNFPFPSRPIATTTPTSSANTHDLSSPPADGNNSFSRNQTAQMHRRAALKRCAHSVDSWVAASTYVSAIQTPVLVLHGEHDTFVAMSNSKRLSEMLPNSEFAVIADAAHYSWEDSTDVCLQHILDWTDKVESGKVESGR